VENWIRSNRLALFHQEALAAADDVRVEPSAEPPVGGHQQKLHPAERADGHQRVGREVRLGPGARQLRQHFVDELGVGAGAHHRVLRAPQLGRRHHLMALVIFCVFRTDRMRVRMKRRDATFPYAFADSVGRNTSLNSSSARSSAARTSSVRSLFSRRASAPPGGGSR